MRKILSSLLLISLFICSPDLFANGLSLNSPGPKGLGMGGAMIGHVNDYTAIYWNPAGMSRIKGTHIGLFVTDIIPIGTYKVTFPAQMGGAVIDATTKTNHYIAPNIMAYVPLMEGDLTVGIGAYVPAGLGAEWDGAELLPFSGMTGKEFKWSNQIGVFNISPGVSYQLTKCLSVGAAANIFYGMLDMERPMDALDMTGETPVPGEDNVMDSQYIEESTGMGFGFSFGLLYQPIDLISVGFSFKSSVTIDMNGDATNSVFALNPQVPEKSEFDRDLGWPMWIGGGVAVHPIDNLTLAIDVQWSQWSESEEKIETEYKSWPSPTTGTPPYVQEMHFNWEDKMQIRFGAQYEFTDNLALRAGFYTDPAPSPDETLTIIFPSISYNGITFGGSYKFGNIGIDVGMEYLMGEDREIPFGKYADAMPGTHGMDIFAASIGVSYTFGSCEKE